MVFPTLESLKAIESKHLQDDTQAGAARSPRRTAQRSACLPQPLPRALVSPAPNSGRRAPKKHPLGARTPPLNAATECCQ